MTPPVTVAVSTLGCRLNQVESQELMGLLERHGFRPVTGEELAQVHVVNTCTVTSRADFSDRQQIRRITRDNPDALLVVTGCYAQTDPQGVASLPGVDLVIGNQDKYRLPELLASLVNRERPDLKAADRAAGRRGRRASRSTAGGWGSRVRGERSDDAPPAEASDPEEVGENLGTRDVPVAPLARVSGRSRAFLKIQDGCQHRCAFCIVPMARGGSRSRDPKVVLEQIETLVDAGYRDITLSGVDIGHYGWDLVPRTTLGALIRRVVETPGLRWLRLSSVLPAYFTAELIEVVTGSLLVAPHLHLPLQSGSDRVLRLMRRPYNTGMYRALVERLARGIPGLGLGTDLIVGHPGERDEDFAATLGLVRELPFSYLHVFAYSPRKGTEATRLPDRVASRVIRERSRRLRDLGRQKNLEFRRGMVGQRREVLVLAERDRDTGWLCGLTSNYVEVVFGGPEGLARRLAVVRITGAGAGRTFATLEEVSA